MQPAIITPTQQLDTSFPKLDVRDFNTLIINYGYKALLEKYIPCPCSHRNGNYPLTTCITCRGSGRAYINPTEATILLQQMNKNNKYERWTEENIGTVSISCRYEDRLSIQDKITLIQGESVFTERLEVHELKSNILGAYTIYKILDIEQLYMYVSDSVPLKLLQPIIDYVVGENFITLTKKYSKNVNELSLSIRYRYRPEYIIIDIPRDVMVSSSRNCNDDGIESNFPIHCIARMTHQQQNASN